MWPGFGPTPIDGIIGIENGDSVPVRIGPGLATMGRRLGENND